MSTLISPKMKVYVKIYDGQSKLMYFSLKMMTYWKYIILFGMDLTQMLKENLIGNLSTIKNTENQNQILR